VDTAIHQIEFHRKERTNSPYPYGIKLMLGIAGTLIHGADPIEVLNLDDSFKKLREDLKKNHFLEDKIRHYFINNPHRVTFTLSPDTNLQEKEDQSETERLEKISSGLTAEDLKKIDDDTEKLLKLQEKEEDISLLPTLSLQDISPDITKIKPSGDYKQIPALYYNQPTSGIYYFSAVSGAGGIKQELLDYIPLFSHVLARIGTSKQDYVKLTRKINATTGGIMVSSQPRTDYTPREECLPLIMFSGKALARNRHHLYDILSELCSDYDFSDLDRLKNLLHEYRAGLESAVVQNGRSFSISLASSTMTQSGYVSEKWKGLTHLKFIKQILDDKTDDKIEDLSDKLKQIADHIISQNNMKYAIVGQESFLKDSETLLGSLHSSLNHSGKHGFHKPEITLPDQILQSGMYTNTAVSFVAQAHPVVRLNHRDAPALSVISKMMRSMYLHREIREKGGAYGGFAIYNSEDGIFNFGSYRDPHILNTLDVFENASTFITKGRFTDEDIKEAILQVCSGIDKPDSPGASAKKSFFRHILSLKDEDRHTFKENLLKMNKQQIIQAAETYFDKGIKRSTVVISDREKLEEANKKLKGRLILDQI